MGPKLNLTEQDGYAALQGHLVDRACQARETYPDLGSVERLRELLMDPNVVRFPTRLEFDSEPLHNGEFAWARPEGDHPRDGFTMVVHPQFEERQGDLPLLVAYHIPSINYVDVVTHRECELYGAALMGMPLEDYYQRLCGMADELPHAPDFEMQKRVVAQVTGLPLAGTAPIESSAPVAVASSLSSTVSAAVSAAESAAQSSARNAAAGSGSCGSGCGCGPS